MHFKHMKKEILSSGIVFRDCRCYRKTIFVFSTWREGDVIENKMAVLGNYGLQPGSITVSGVQGAKTLLGCYAGN